MLLPKVKQVCRKNELETLDFKADLTNFRIPNPHTAMEEAGWRLARAHTHNALEACLVQKYQQTE
jgi:hypothetical protein